MPTPPRAPPRLWQDLAWVAQSPDLLRPEALGTPLATGLRPPAADQGTALPGPEPQDFRLGRHFERLVALLVAEQCQPERLATGIQICADGRSLGELDLCFAKVGVHHHWELACKFYLYQPGSGPARLEEYLGPQRRDRLDKKTAVLRDRQLPLARHPAAQAQLQDWPDLQSAALIRGRLFYPCDRDWQHCTAAPEVDPAHLRGWWAMPGMASRIPRAQRFLPLPRELWLAPLQSASSPAQSLRELWPSASARPLLVAGLDAEGRELHRGFLLPEDWTGRPDGSAD